MIPFALLLACGPDAKDPSDSAVAEVLPDDPRFAFGQVRACADPSAAMTPRKPAGRRSGWRSALYRVAP